MTPGLKNGCKFAGGLILLAALSSTAPAAQPYAAPPPAAARPAQQSEPLRRSFADPDQEAYPGYYGARTYAPTYYGFGVGSALPRGYGGPRPFHGYGYRPKGYAGIYRPFYYRHGFYRPIP